MKRKKMKEAYQAIMRDVAAKHQPKKGKRVPLPDVDITRRGKRGKKAVEPKYWGKQEAIVRAPFREILSPFGGQPGWKRKKK